MKARPIMFSGPMVRALLEGRKTQTRRIVKLAKDMHVRDLGGYHWPMRAVPGHWSAATSIACPYGKRGDLLWVRETFIGWYDNTKPGRPFSHVAAFAADGYELEPGERWTPCIHMPRLASRLTLRLTDVRVQRLQEISKDDAIAEGAKQWDVLEGTSARLPRWSMEPQTSEQCCMHGPQMAFANYINKLHGGENWNLKPSNLWAENPWVWALTFEILRENVDSVIEPAKAVA